MAVAVWTERRVNPAREELLWMLQEARSRKRRDFSRFLEEEVRLPTGPMAGERYQLDTQPYARHFAAAVDSGRYREFLATGPTQSGKTLTTALGPMGYHLFEWQESGIFGIPNDDMRRDKWEDDILPMIEATRFRELLPTRGAGSRGGDPGARVRFNNGVVLRFMTGGGGDKSRAGKTARWVVITEVEGFEVVKSTSAESTQIEQLKARTHAFGSRGRVYMECTVTTSTAFVWREFEAGTKSRPWYPCAHCGTWVTLDRENLHGWQDAANEVAAFENAALVCPACGVFWSEADRHGSVQRMVLVHRGQEIGENPPHSPFGKGGRIALEAQSTAQKRLASEGAETPGEKTEPRLGSEGAETPLDGPECLSLGAPVILGAAPETYLFSLRWNGAENLLMDQGQIGVAEWKGAKAENADEAERALCQFWWARAIDDGAESSVELTVVGLAERLGDWERGVCPPDTQCLTAVMDVGKHVTHWAAVAWSTSGSPHVVDYGTITVRWREMGLEDAITAACWEFDSICQAGWHHENETRAPEVRWIDSGSEWAAQIYEFCKTTGYQYRPSKGFGVSQDFERSYHVPKSTGATVLHIGEQYHVAFTPQTGTRLIEVNADYWKSFAWRRMQTPVGRTGALTLYRTLSKDHWAIARHLLAERRELEWVPAKGGVGGRQGGWRERWVQVNRNNHWFDVFYLSCAAAHHGGVRLVRDESEGDGKEVPRRRMEKPVRGRGKRRRRGVVMYRGRGT